MDVFINPDNDPFNLHDAELAYVHRLLNDYEFFAYECLMIVPKEGGTPQRFVFNDAQKIFHRFVEVMYAETGWIRVNVVKGRQQGISAYTDGRLIWECFRQPNYSAWILSHEEKSTQTLFDRCKFFYDNMPPQYRSEQVTSNRMEFKFRNGSKIKVMTANSEETGRSQTAQGGHESERGFYKKPDSLDAGIGQTVADIPNTTKIRESTGNGKNHFYIECVEGLPDANGRFLSMYRTIFIPWYLQQEYRLPIPAALIVDGHLDYVDDEEELKDLYNLDDEQIYWRREKIKFLKSLRKFKQEYPFTFEEAFQETGDQFFDAAEVEKARKRRGLQALHGAWIIGCDVGRRKDRTVIAERRSRVVSSVEERRNTTDTEVAGILSKKIDTALSRGFTVRCFLDYALGTGAFDILVERGYRRYVELVDFGGKSSEVQYLNKRVEMHFRLREWFENEVSIPDDDAIAVDLAMIPDSKLNTQQKHTLISKDQIRDDNGGRSPDITDALCLTFAEDVRDESHEPFHIQNAEWRQVSEVSELATRRRILHNSDDDTYGRRGRFQ